MAGSDPQPETITAAAAHASRVHLGVGIPLLTIGLAIYFVRMWFRIRPAWRVGAEDYCITVGVVGSPNYPSEGHIPRLTCL